MERNVLDLEVFEFSLSNLKGLIRSTLRSLAWRCAFHRYYPHTSNLNVVGKQSPFVSRMETHVSTSKKIFKLAKEQFSCFPAMHSDSFFHSGFGLTALKHFSS